MGCGMSKSKLIDDAFGKRTKPSPKLLIKDSPQPQPESKPPELQKIKTSILDNNNGDGGGGGGGEGGRNSNVDPPWFGSPSFREYIKSSPLAATTTCNEQEEKETITFTCNQEACGWGHARGNTEQDKKETRVGRFRKVFQVQKATFWHPWHIGHPKATKKAA